MIGKLHIETLTEKGPAREKNQDDYLTRVLFEEGNEIFIAAVADGVGSFDQSELASAYISRSISDFAKENSAKKLCEMDFEDIEIYFLNFVLKIHDELKSIAKKSNFKYGSTLTLLCIIENSFFVIQVGDSRCYLHQNGTLRQITRDQTLAEKMRLNGDEEISKKDESTLLQCMGQGTINPSLYDGILDGVFELILCTDGLSNTLSNKEILRMLERNKREMGRLEPLFEKARKNKETDNITAILVRNDKKCLAQRKP